MPNEDSFEIEYGEPSEIKPAYEFVVAKLFDWQNKKKDKHILIEITGTKSDKVKIANYIRRLGWKCYLSGTSLQSSLLDVYRK